MTTFLAWRRSMLPSTYLGGKVHRGASTEVELELPAAASHAGRDAPLRLRSLG